MELLFIYCSEIPKLGRETHDPLTSDCTWENLNRLFWESSPFLSMTLEVVLAASTQVTGP